MERIDHKVYIEYVFLYMFIFKIKLITIQEKTYCVESSKKKLIL